MPGSEWRVPYLAMPSWPKLPNTAASSYTTYNINIFYMFCWIFVLLIARKYRLCLFNNIFFSLLFINFFSVIHSLILDPNWVLYAYWYLNILHFNWNISIFNYLFLYHACTTAFILWHSWTAVKSCIYLPSQLYIAYAG